MSKLRQSRSGLYDVTSAFSGENVGRMCHGEEKSIFVKSSDGAVLELNISATTFTKVKKIRIGDDNGLCYVPDPHRLLIVCDENEVRAVSCDD